MPSSTLVAAIRWGAAIATVALLAAGTVSVVGFLLISTKTETSHFREPVTHVQLTGFEGDVVIRADPAQLGASVISRGHSSFRTAKHRETVSDGVLQVNGSCGSSATSFLGDRCSVDFEITVPPGTAVTARTTIGNVSVTGTGGRTSVDSDTGDIRVQQASGSIQLSTDVGDVTGEHLDGGVVMGQSNTGDIRLTFTAAPDQITAKSDIGDVRVQVPDDATSYAVSADVGIGERRVDVPTDPRSDHVVRLSTSTGDIRIGRTR